MGYHADDSTSSKVPDMSSLQRQEYQQTVPVEEELDLPPSYEEASSSRAARSQGISSTNPSTIATTPATALSPSCRSSSEAGADDALLRHPSTAAARQAEEQRRQRERQRCGREQQHKELNHRCSCNRHENGCRRSADSQNRLSVVSDVDNVGYKPTNPMYWDAKAQNGDWDKHSSEPGCCGSSTGGCCFSSRGGCCFSDRDGCCFSDRDGCCFSDRGGCMFSDLDGACFSDGGACCFSDRPPTT